MASNRQERLQMRQRGAGTRKIQAVDFGFSFGSPTGAAPVPSISQRLESVPETTNAAASIVDTTLPDSTAPVTEQSTRETPTRILRNSTASTESPRRSDRVSIGRVSTPNNTTEEQEEGRSSKRRRISTKNDDLIRSAMLESEAIVNPSPLVIREDHQQNDEQNGVDARTEFPDVPMIDMARDEDLPETTVIKQDAEPRAIAKTSRRGRPKSTESQANGTANPKQTADQIRRHSIRQSEVNGSDPPDQENSNQDGQFSRTRGRQGLEKQSTVEIEPEVDREPEQEDRVTEPSLSKRGRRRKEPEQPEMVGIEPEVNREPEQEESVPQSSTTKRGRRRKEPEQPEPEQQDEDENNEPTEKASRGRRKRGRPSTAENVEADEPQEEEETAQTRSKRKGKNREREPEEGPNVVETQERVEEAQKSKDKARRKQQPQENGESSRRRGRPFLDKAQEPQPEAETTDITETRPEASTKPVQPANRRRGRPSAGAPEERTTSGQRTKRRREQDENQEPRRREGTVAITVHRLANTHILDHAASDPSDDEQDSTDELEAVGKKFPSRNGVNAADVLCQICKEILDKHLTTLDTNIASDAANQAKRSEYARQRKAIEAYGTQLEGRLFELSELLDSNFSLGVQLKKAKREAAEMRNRLLEVRQQRHEITLRMDAVRRKHGEEENAKMSRNAINNTLHNLDLTLDRNRSRADDDDGTNDGNGVAGLEFLLRSVSENVSSAAEGSYGGLLSQVKAFNAQLEMTARKLER
ncbi:Hypothetical protein PENO1_032660 [Penicillium occitanis (nom. inval.)]|nr:Hypothetical protein PENO1_032660 [Penicillium occitanis (nom. inval.)]PCH04391.1 hypothetical protein PENOC_033800 [Penicillium occitanis (nom. inval.)]